VGGVLIAFVPPEIGSIILVGIPLTALWLTRASPRFGVLTVVAVVGIVVDLLWQAAHPGFSEQGMNLLLLPGPVIQLVGWVMGLEGSGILQARS
jgi:hypothetical protein